MTHRPTARRDNLTVDFLQHDGVEEVSGCHVGLLFVQHGRELVEANFSGRQLRGCSFLKQTGGKSSRRTLRGVSQSDSWGAFAVDKNFASVFTPFSVNNCGHVLHSLCQPFHRKHSDNGSCSGNTHPSGSINIE